MKLISIIILGALACVTTSLQARSVNPKHLTEINPPIEYQLSVDVPVEGYNITFTLRAGTYMLSYKDSKGVYLLGQGQCMHWDIHSPKMTGSNDFPCGIYLPNDTSRGASFYVIRAKTGTNPDAGVLVNSIIRYNYGSFDWPEKKESQELRSKLELVTP
jgi:hypothetical protein